MSNDELLQKFLDSLPEKRVPYYRKPLADFLEHLESQELTINDINPELVNEYTAFYQLRKLKLVRFLEYLLKFLEFYNIQIDNLKLNKNSQVEHYYNFDILANELDKKIEMAVAPDLICTGVYDSFKAVIYLEWLGLSTKEISEIKIKDVQDNGITVGDIVVEYDNERLKKFLLEYKMSDGYMRKNSKGICFINYIDNDCFIHAVKAGKDDLMKVHNLLRRASELNMDNRIIIESALFYRTYQSELKGDKVTFPHQTQINAYKRYKRNLKKYMEA